MGWRKRNSKSGLSLSRKIRLKEPLSIQEEISFSIDKYELKEKQITDLLTRDYYLDVLEASRVRTPQERMHYRTIVECMKNDVDRSLQARCEELLNCWRCGNALLEEDVECSYYAATSQLNRFEGLGCGTCGCPLPIAPDVIARETLKRFQVAWVDSEVQYAYEDKEENDYQQEEKEDELDNQDPNIPLAEAQVHTVQVHNAKEGFSEVFDTGTQQMGYMNPTRDVRSHTYSNVGSPILAEAEEIILAIGRVYVDSPRSQDERRYNMYSCRATFRGALIR